MILGVSYSHSNSESKFLDRESKRAFVERKALYGANHLEMVQDQTPTSEILNQKRLLDVVHAYYVLDVVSLLIVQREVPSNLIASHALHEVKFDFESCIA